LLGLAGRVIFEEEVVEMSIPQQKQTITELEERDRADVRTLEYYERQWERELREREERGEKRGEKRGERKALLLMAADLVDQEQYAQLQELDLDALREQTVGLQRELVARARDEG